MVLSPENPLVQLATALTNCGSHLANDLEVTKTILEILQPVPAHPEITKEAPNFSSEKWEKQPQHGK